MTSTELLHLWPSLRTVIDQPARARNGKIAQLPEPTRQSINEMLDAGLPYRAIIERLGEAGRHLNAQNLSNWKHLGGYQAWRTRNLRAVVLKAVVNPDGTESAEPAITTLPLPPRAATPPMVQAEFSFLPPTSSALPSAPAPQITLIKP